jgi:predicted O-methyltransferase YrrM
MRGPLLSGALGSPATLGRVCNLVRAHSPLVVLSALWLAETLASEIEVVALVEAEKHSAAQRALRRAHKLGHSLSVVIAAAEVPLAPGSVGTVLVDSLVDIEEQPAARDLIVALLPALKPDGIVVSLDATKSPSLEARVSEIFLAASLARITQIRPREGALLTTGDTPHAAVTAARIRTLLPEQ